jgi:Protein of unknown function (DUF3309)
LRNFDGGGGSYRIQARNPTVSKQYLSKQSENNVVYYACNKICITPQYGESSPNGETQKMLILLIILILVFGFGGYRMGPGIGYYGGGGLSLILIIVVILLLLKVI